MRFFGFLVFLLLLSSCEAGTVLVVPTDPPTETATYTASPTRTPGHNATPTRQPTRVAQSTGGPSPTPLFGASRTPIPENYPTSTRAFNPNAPRIEFFTSDPLTIEPGAIVTLYWSTRGVDKAVIYRLDEDGNRTQAYNVAAAGNLPIDTLSSERGELGFLLSIGEGADSAQETITIPLECPVEWFFIPAPDECATASPTETRIVDMTMERGRLVYIEELDTIYALFNDGQQPAWSSFENRYNPEIHPAREESAPPEWIQPLDQLGYVWRTQSDVRARLGLGLQEAVSLDGFIQTAPARGGREVIYLTGLNGVVLQIVPGNDLWQIIGGPR